MAEDFTDILSVFAAADKMQKNKKKFEQDARKFFITSALKMENNQLRAQGNETRKKQFQLNQQQASQLSPGQRQNTMKFLLGTDAVGGQNFPELDPTIRASLEKILVSNAFAPQQSQQPGFLGPQGGGQQPIQQQASQFPGGGQLPRQLPGQPTGTAGADRIPAIRVIARKVLINNGFPATEKDIDTFLDDANNVNLLTQRLNQR